MLGVDVNRFTWPPTKFRLDNNLVLTPVSDVSTGAYAVTPPPLLPLCGSIHIYTYKAIH